MFAIKRYDPAQPGASTSSSVGAEQNAAIDEVLKKVEERKKARKSQMQNGVNPAAVTSGETNLNEMATPSVANPTGWTPAPGESPAERERRIKREKRASRLGISSEHMVQSTSSAAYEYPPPYPSNSSVAKHLSATDPTAWKPAPGESPMEREKRIKQEKRAQRLGISLHDSPGAPAASSILADSPHGELDLGGTEVLHQRDTNMPAIHPSRIAAAPLLAKEIKESGPPKEKTPAKKKYLQKKKQRAKGKKAGAPKDKILTKVDHEAIKKRKRDDSDSGSDEAAEDGEVAADTSLSEEAIRKSLEIKKKKEERRMARLAKKAELRRMKAAGEAPEITRRPIISQEVKMTPFSETSSLNVAPVVNTADEIKEVSPELTVEEEEERAALAARRDAKRLKRSTRRLSASVEPEADKVKVPAEVDVIPPGMDDIVTSLKVEERAALLRLPAATRPAPPSAKTLNFLNVHGSVRDKILIDPGLTGSLDTEVIGISERGLKRLSDMGIKETFAVQTAVLPILLPSIPVTEACRSISAPQDVCVSAPTGSGKTLSYVIPIVEALSSRIVCRLRALIILPTRDLVNQVRETFEAYGGDTSLKLGSATGQQSFSHEQMAIVGSEAVDLVGGISKVDILIATPGRLMDHIRSTPGFSLQHLRYLVIDEADRLMTQSFNEWLPSILSALRPTISTISNTLHTGRADALAPEWWSHGPGAVSSEFDEPGFSSCQKLLFSATLSRDPAKIDALNLNRPIYISVEDPSDENILEEGQDDDQKFTLPSLLKEHMIISPASHKPLYLFHLLHDLSLTSALCFTKSVEAATRLAKLFQFFDESRSKDGDGALSDRKTVCSYSSELAPKERNRILSEFRKGNIQMLICSDLVSRGIDLPDVSHVINYDIPNDMKKYVHRVGRTARAGKAGDAWTLVEDQEVAPFKAIMRASSHYQKIKRVRIKDELVKPFVPHYQTALEQLRLHFAS